MLVVVFDTQSLIS